jgi:sarcosine oxidase subunit beta
VSRKVILCRCEDVTLADVQRAVKLGTRDLEEVKRYTGFGTGLAPFTSRPPLVPTELGVLARGARK